MVGVLGLPTAATRPDDSVAFRVEHLPGFGHGPMIDRDALRRWGLASAPAWSAPANRPLPAIRQGRRRPCDCALPTRSECPDTRPAPTPKEADGGGAGDVLIALVASLVSAVVWAFRSDRCTVCRRRPATILGKYCATCWTRPAGGIK